MLAFSNDYYGFIFRVTQSVELFCTYNDIASGIGMGMATVVVAFVGLVEVKNRLTKSKNKGDEANQEKTDEE